jgi:hypothetical protein
MNRATIQFVLATSVFWVASRLPMLAEVQSKGVTR